MFKMGTRLDRTPEEQLEYAGECILTQAGQGADEVVITTKSALLLLARARECQRPVEINVPSPRTEQLV